MENLVFIILLVFFCTLSSSLAQQIQECPSPFSIAPCTCDMAWDKKARIRCEYSPEVTQSHVDLAFATYRKVNNLTGPNDWLHMKSFTLADTQMTSLDLTPFLRTTMTSFSINYNSRLEAFTGPELMTNETEGAISTEAVFFHTNALTSSGIGNSLRYFNPLNLTWLDLSSNNISELAKSNSSSSEFLPGLFTFKNLEALDLGVNKIGVLRAGSFKELTRLRLVELQLNILMVLEDDSLVLDDPPPPVEGEEPRKLKVSLRMNDYTNNPDIYVGPKRIGLDKIRGRDISLDLTWSFIETLPEDQYYDFLMQNYEEQRNTIDTWNSGLQECDERMDWLKALKSQLGGRVYPFPC